MTRAAAAVVGLAGFGPEAGASPRRLDGFEGPLDLLLELARLQKVDLGRISILRLVEQYLAAVDGVRPEPAADWLVMAAWLAWLKSRLLLPEPVAREAGGTAAQSLQARLAEVREAAARLQARPLLVRDVCLCGTYGRAARRKRFARSTEAGCRLDLGRLLATDPVCSRRRARRAV